MRRIQFYKPAPSNAVYDGRQICAVYRLSVSDGSMYHVKTLNHYLLYISHIEDIERTDKWTYTLTLPLQ